MNTIINRITAIFDDRVRAELAASELRVLGVDESQISLIARHDEAAAQPQNAEIGSESSALLKVAVALTPVVGPIYVAGKLVSAAARGGGVTGSIAALLTGLGFDESEAREVGATVESGRTLLVIDTTNLDENMVRALLFKHGARDATA